MKKSCPIYQVVRFVGKRWTLLILTELYKRKKWKRYSELKRALPWLTPKMLSSRLRDLEKEGLVQRRVDSSQFPIKSEYSLTKRGLEFFEVIELIKNWGLKWKIGDADCPNLDCKDCEF